MNHEKHLAVIGGDSRQIHMATRLQKHGYMVHLAGFDLAQLPEGLCCYPLAEVTETTNTLILPLPVSRDSKTLNAAFAKDSISLHTLLQNIRPGSKVFCGMPPTIVKSTLEALHCEIADYFCREDLTVQNALLTAEGLIGILTDQLPVTVFGMTCAITGYGRVAKFTARALRALGADVTVFARSNTALTQAKADFLKAFPLEELQKKIGEYFCIINTVPSMVIPAETVHNAANDSVFIEVASAPFGIDFDAVAKSGRQLIKAVSLPGKTAPKTAGEIIADTIDKMLTEGFS